MIFVECRLPNGTKEYFVVKDRVSLQADAFRTIGPRYTKVRVVNRKKVEEHKFKYFEVGVTSVKRGRSKTYLLGAIRARQATDTQ